MRLILSALVVLSSSLAVADNPPIDVQSMKGSDCERARKAGKTCVLDMGEEKVEGVVGKGEGEGITAAQFTKMTSLIRIRRDFITEILKSAEDID